MVHNLYFAGLASPPIAERRDLESRNILGDHIRQQQQFRINFRPRGCTAVSTKRSFNYKSCYLNKMIRPFCLFRTFSTEIFLFYFSSTIFHDLIEIPAPGRRICCICGNVEISSEDLVICDICVNTCDIRQYHYHCPYI